MSLILGSKEAIRLLTNLNWLDVLGLLCQHIIPNFIERIEIMGNENDKRNSMLSI